MTQQTDRDLGAIVRTALGEPPKANFDRWLEIHRESLAYLNPVVTQTYWRQRRLLLRLGGCAAVAAIFVVAAFLVFDPEKQAFAQTIDSIQQAKTMSWTIEWYNREYSVDGSHSWLRRSNNWERSYLEPGRWRDVRYADDGTVAFVTIENTSTNEVLSLNMKKRTATLRKEPSGQFGGGRPFSNITTILRRKPIEFVGQKEIDGVTANVFRHQREFKSGEKESIEIWIDAKSKQLIRTSTTRGDRYFDPQTDPDRNNKPEPKFSWGTIGGVIERDIKVDAQLDPSLFSMTPPEGFTIVDPPSRPKVTQEQMIQWLRLLAEANGGVFLQWDRDINMQWHNAIARKPKDERSEAEKKYMEVYRKHMLDGNRRPIEEFVEAFTEPGSFRYFGKGVSLGSKSRIVCYYKLKSTGQYQAVYGDLRVAPINASDLPLPVE